MNKKYDPETFSYGCELEFADVDRFAKLPDGCAFDGKDHTVVNSTGIATDPQAETCKYGGEINVKPTKTIQEQVKLIGEILNSFDRVTVNYRCNLHIHVRVPGLKEDLQACKQLAKYIRENEQDVFNILEPIPKPTEEQYPTSESFAGAMKRYKRRHRSHQFRIHESAYQRLMKANTVEEFFNGHAPYSASKSKYCFHLVPRAAINLRPLWETHHNTIEFRHFPGTLELTEYENCLTWCMLFLDAALNTGKPVKQIIAEHPEITFPKFAPYNHEQEQIYLLTSYDHCTRVQIRENLKHITPISRYPAGSISRHPIN